MGLAIEILILTILIIILGIFLMDEKRIRRARSASGKMIGYWDGTERRTSVRIETILTVKYSIDKKPQQKKNSLSKNISSGGILIEISEKLQPSTQLLLDIVLPNEEKSLAAKGEVVWIKELLDTDESGRRLFDTGAKFVSMSPKDKERLDKFIKGMP